MATVIDTLIVELGLDPKKFTTGQREAMSETRRALEEGKRGGKDIERQADAINNTLSKLKGQALKGQAQLLLAARRRRRNRAGRHHHEGGRERLAAVAHARGERPGDRGVAGGGEGGRRHRRGRRGAHDRPRQRVPAGRELPRADADPAGSSRRSTPSPSGSGAWASA
jgi:hypothetical protein